MNALAEDPTEGRPPVRRRGSTSAAVAGALRTPEAAAEQVGTWEDRVEIGPDHEVGPRTKRVYD